MPRMHLFFDDGGVLNDNSLRGPQWQEHVGAFLAPRLGGDAAAWAEANRVAVPSLWRKYGPVMGGVTNPDDDVAAIWDAYQLDWLRTMAAHTGRPAPASEAECIALAIEASIYVTERVRADYPGVVDTLRRLHAEDFPLYTSSSQVSWEIDGYLRAMEVRELFPARLYGQDLLGIAKGHRLYFDRLFADAGVDPASAVVFDDKAEVLRFADAAGAGTTVLVGPRRPAGYEGLMIASLAQISEVLPA